MTVPIVRKIDKLPWPFDHNRITYDLRREGCRSIGRMNGKEENLELVIEVLRVLAKHAKDKLEHQKKHKANIQVLAEKRIAARLAAAEHDRTLKKLNIKADMRALQVRMASLNKEDEAVVQAMPVKVKADLRVYRANNPVPDLDVPKTKAPPKSKKLSDVASKQGLGAPRMG